MAMCGIGFGFFQAPNLKSHHGAARRRSARGASGIVATARLIGQATGAALRGLLYSSSQQERRRRWRLAKRAQASRAIAARQLLAACFVAPAPHASR